METLRLDFMGWRHLASAVSIVLVVASLIGLVWPGLSPGIEFTGGALFEVAFPAPLEPAALRAALADGGFGDAVVQASGSERGAVIRTPTSGRSDVGALAGELEGVLITLQPGARIDGSEVVGPAVGAELRDSAGLAALAAFAAVGVYIMVRFAGRFAVGVIVGTYSSIYVASSLLLTLGVTRASLMPPPAEQEPRP